MIGRPRDGDLDKRLLLVGWSLLQRVGYDALTLTQVAAQAHAHRTDIYRRWSSKASFIVGVLAEHLPPIADIDTGALRSDLSAIVTDFAVSWSSPWISGLVGLIGDLQNDLDAELAFRRMAERRGQPLRDAVVRARHRGEIHEVGDLSLLGDLIEGPLMHRRMLGRQPLTPEYLDEVVELAHRVLCAGRVKQ